MEDNNTGKIATEKEIDEVMEAIGFHTPASKLVKDEETEESKAVNDILKYI